MEDVEKMIKIANKIRKLKEMDQSRGNTEAALNKLKKHGSSLGKLYVVLRSTLPQLLGGK